MEDEAKELNEGGVCVVKNTKIVHACTAFKDANKCISEPWLGCSWSTDKCVHGPAPKKVAPAEKTWVEQLTEGAKTAADKAKTMVEGAVTKGKEAVEKVKVEAGKVVATVKESEAGKAVAEGADKAKTMVEGAVTKGKEAVEKGKVEAGKVVNGAAMKVSELVSSHNEGVFNDKKVTKAS